MNILYIGETAPASTSRHRADALARLGHAVELWDPSLSVARWRKSGPLQKLHNLSGQRLLVGFVERWLTKQLSTLNRPDLVWINSGELLSVKAVSALKALKVPLVLYNNDDPTGARDDKRFLQVRSAVNLFDLCVLLRRSTAEEMLKLGAKRALVVSFSYDEVQHRPLEKNETISEASKRDVVFVGSWMRGENREQVLNHLREAGLRLTIWGPRWNKSRFKEMIKDCWRGAWISGRDYVGAIAGATICLGLLSKGNRDLHTQRSVEIPYAGGLFCAERTSAHTAMFKEGHEAVFWDSPEECVRVCHNLLADEERRRAIVAAGMRRVREMRVGNEDVCRKILNALFS